MLVKCEKCGYENFPQHRFCGMCAAPLRIPGAAATQPLPPPAPTALPPVQLAAPKYERRPATSAKEAAPQQVSGPSFLGLGQEPAEDKSFSYLFEDETPSHRGRNLVMILLLAGAAAATWHWRQDLRVVADRLLNTLPAAEKPAAANKTDSTAPVPAPADSTAGTSSSSSSSTPSEPGGVVPGAQTQAAPTPPPAAPDSAATPPAGSGTTAATQAGSEAQTPNQPRADSASGKPSANEGSEKSDSDEAPNPPHARKPAVTKAARTAPTTSRADDLEAQGEKYLYGNGVAENCARARTNLLAAAQHSNPQAESVLGTMYATGHCATRDLPTAYRWFGRSLRQDPKNIRLEQDLKVLWNQMTPGERQLAMRNEH